MRIRKDTILLLSVRYLFYILKLLQHACEELVSILQETLPRDCTRNPTRNPTKDCSGMPCRLAARTTWHHLHSLHWHHQCMPERKKSRHSNMKSDVLPDSWRYSAYSACPVLPNKTRYTAHIWQKTQIYVVYLALPERVHATPPTNCMISDHSHNSALSCHLVGIIRRKVICFLCALSHSPH